MWIFLEEHHPQWIEQGQVAEGKASMKAVGP
jgi:hypothetical protein